MKPFLIASLTFVSLTAGISAAEEETGHMTGRAAKAPGHPGYAQVSDDDKQMDRAVVDKHVNVNRNIYYGGHHFARDWHGSHAVAHTALHRDRR